MNDIEQWERERLLESLDSYRRGLSDAPYLRKWTSVAAAGESVSAPAFPQASATEAGEQQMAFVVSNDDVDRHGDVISLQGWRLQSYLKNPVFLWAHDYTRPAIGRTRELWAEGNNLVARVQFAPTDFAREVADLYRDGYQRGVSVGFRPIKYELRRDADTGKALGVRFLEQELLEISAAPVPANQGALRKALSRSPRMEAYYARVGLEETEWVSWDDALRQVVESLRYVAHPAT